MFYYFLSILVYFKVVQVVSLHLLLRYSKFPWAAVKHIGLAQRARIAKRQNSVNKVGFSQGLRKAYIAFTDQLQITGSNKI